MRVWTNVGDWPLVWRVRVAKAPRALRPSASAMKLELAWPREKRGVASRMAASIRYSRVAIAISVAQAAFVVGVAYAAPPVLLHGEVPPRGMILDAPRPTTIIGSYTDPTTGRNFSFVL